MVRRRHATRLTHVAIWAMTVTAAGALILGQYRHIFRARIGPDFAVYYAAARNSAHGISPYGVAKFVYSPLVALIVQPLTYANLTHAFKIWTVANLVMVAVAIGLFVAAMPPTDASWHRPAMVVICAGSAAYFWPLKVAILLGQSDPLVFVVLMAAMLSAAVSRTASQGIFMSGAGLVKVWPFALVVVIAQTGRGDRRRLLVAFVGTAVIAPAMALLWGWHGVWGLWHNVVVARVQHQVSRSLWGTSDLLFTRTGFARPLVVSSGLHITFVIVMCAWILGLAAIALRTPHSPGLCMWTILGCIVLLLPVCHTAYSLYFLPLLWIWVARSLRAGTTRLITLMVAIVLVIWWLVMTHTWPDNESSPTLSSLRYSIDFFADLIALTASVTGAYIVTSRDGAASACAPTAPRSMRPIE